MPPPRGTLILMKQFPRGMRPPVGPLSLMPMLPTIERPTPSAVFPARVSVGEPSSLTRGATSQSLKLFVGAMSLVSVRLLWFQSRPGGVEVLATRPDR